MLSLADGAVSVAGGAVILAKGADVAAISVGLVAGRPAAVVFRGMTNVVESGSSEKMLGTSGVTSGGMLALLGIPVCVSVQDVDVGFTEVLRVVEHELDDLRNAGGKGITTVVTSPAIAADPDVCEVVTLGNGGKVISRVPARGFAGAAALACTGDTSEEAVGSGHRVDQVS